MASLTAIDETTSFALNPIQISVYEQGDQASDDDTVICGVYLDNGLGKAIADKRPIVRLGELRNLVDRIERFVESRGMTALRFIDPTLRLQLSDKIKPWSVKAAGSDPRSTTSKMEKTDDDTLDLSITYMVEQEEEGSARMEEFHLTLETSYGRLRAFGLQLGEDIDNVEPPPERSWDELPV